MKSGGSKKGRKASRNKATGVYLRQKARTTATKHRRAIKRETQRAFFKAHPEAGSPSQIARRGKW